MPAAKATHGNASIAPLSITIAPAKSFAALAAPAAAGANAAIPFNRAPTEMPAQGRPPTGRLGLHLLF